MSLATLTPTAARAATWNRRKKGPTLAERADRNAEYVANLDQVIAYQRIDPNGNDLDRERLQIHCDHHAIIREIARRHRRDRLPTWAEWKYAMAPIWTHREGGKLYLVVPADNANSYGDEDLPESIDVLITFARLVVIDDPAV